MTTLALLLLLPTPEARAQEGSAMAARTAEFWLARLRQSYRTTPIAERISMRVERGPERGSELVVYASQPLEGFREPEIWIDLGRIEIWTRPPGQEEGGAGLVRAAHELDYRSYFEAEPVGGTTLETLRRAVPPLMLPQVALSLGGPLFPALGEVLWTGVSEERPFGEAPRVTLTGVASDAEVELVIEAGDRARLLVARFEVEPGPVEVTLECEAFEPFDRRLGYDVSRRERLEAIADLAERPGDLRAGDPLPEMALVHFTLDMDERLTEAYRQRLLLFFDGHATADGVLPEGAQIGLDALRAARERFGPTTRLDGIGVIDPFSTDGRHIQVLELDLDEALDPDPAFYTYTERHTVRRFIAEGDDCIVVASKDGTIAGVIDLGGVAERAEREGRDAVVASLAARVEELCRLIARRDRGLE